MPLSTSHIEDIFTSKEEGIKKLLSSILNLNLQHEFNEKHIISVINKLLSTAKHRKEGLEYLDLVIGNCSHSAIAENAINWTSHCIIKFPDDVLRELKLRVLGDIIEVAHNESEFNKKFVSDYISKVLDNCTTTSHVNPYECKAALKTLTVSMQYYPSWFGAYRQKIEKFLLIFLDQENDELVQNAALAFHYLQQVGSAGPNGLNHKSCFTQNFNKLCRTVHKLYDTFMENEKEIFHTERSSDDNVFEFIDDPSSNSQVLLHINARRIKNVLKFIETMIKEKFPVAKETNPKELLELVTRSTLIHKCISGDSIESLDTYHFSLLLLDIQCAALKLLRLFIIWYQANCLPFSYSISKILVDSVEKSHNCECFNSLYQELSYRALSEWLSVSKSSLHPQFQAQLLVCILKDITPIKTQITLTISEAASGKKSQKAKRRAMADRIISSGNQTLSNDSTTYHKNNEKNTCKFALIALKHLLELTRLNVKPNLLKDLYKSIFNSLTTIQSFKPLHPYTDAQCQAKLYEALVAIYCQNTLSTLPPLQTSLDVLTRGANDSNRFVSEICQKGLRNLEMLCQPICPSLYLGVEKETEEGIEMEEAAGLREMIEIEEMDVGDEEASSVDYDASTDEFSPNVSQNKNFNRPDYEVKLPDTDSSENGELNDKDTTEDFRSNESPKACASPESLINEIQSDFVMDGKVSGTGANNEQDKFGNSDHRTITVSSDEEIENLESENLESNPVERIKEEDDNSEQSCSRDFLQENIKEGTANEVNNRDHSGTKESAEDIAETIEADPVSDTGKTYLDENDKEIVDTREKSKIEQGEATTTIIKEKSDAEENSVIEGLEKEQEKCSETKRQKEKVDSADQPMDSDEPVAKKAKPTSEDDLDIDDVFEEQIQKKDEEVEPDSNDLEDDSFVDAVKDYY